ncbi:Crp/Fnr family transcriptional regulator [Mesobaculum littorinae]|uniref:Crp/Fnr family transcriptional regulator n=1 Tax=Mesobaculum littorinae TaxID=2486419 RepID=A0A438AIN4_9RHOB|nr:Crp/Fnr family transcriptional regulator [Mesobaculum littorinae]RVV98457.1 Crp/Fnr family transcriptional regulator [Mesobaculum littorinae]
MVEWRLPVSALTEEPETMRDTTNAPSDAQKSCFAHRLERYIDLSNSEAEFVASIEKPETRIAPGGTILSRGMHSERIFVLKSGWAAVRTEQVNGRSQILRIFLPGELIGLPEIGSMTVVHNTVAMTECVVCPMPLDRMSDIYLHEPRLAALLTAIVSLDQIALRERLALMALGTARERLANLLVDLHARLMVANPDIGRRFRLPLRQTDLAEALGLSPVYVSRLLSDFVTEGLIEIDRPYIRLLDRAQLDVLARYVNRYDELDMTWFPPIAPDEKVTAEGATHA